MTAHGEESMAPQELLTAPQVMNRLQLGRALRIPAHALTDFIRTRVDQEAAARVTTPRDTPASRRARANGDGTVYQRKDGRREGAGYVLDPGNTRRRVRVYGTTRKEALAKLTEKIAASNRGLPVPSTQGSVAAYLTYWLENVAVHELRENTHTRCAACVDRYLSPGLGKKKLTKLTAKDIRTWLNQLRTTCQCCARGIDARRDEPRCCAAGQCCHKLLSRADARLHPLGAQVRPGARRARGRDPAQRGLQRPHRHASPPTLRTPHRRRSPPTPHHRERISFARPVRTRPPHRAPQSELLGLRWEDLDLDAGTAAIRRTLQRTSAGGLTTLPTKTRASQRRIALPVRCIQSLKRHREQQQRERKAAGTAWQPNGHVFATAQGDRST